MIRAVYDCNVILSGIGWNGSARKCLKLVAERQVFLFVKDEILAEYEAVIPETLAEEVPEVNPHPKLAWIAGVRHPGRRTVFWRVRVRGRQPESLCAGGNLCFPRVRLQPGGKFLFSHFTGSKRKCAHGGIGLVRLKAVTVQLKKNHGHGETRPLVAVNEWMIFHQAKAVTGGEIEDRRLAVGEKIFWFAQR
jgi:hypothetical protein